MKRKYHTKKQKKGGSCGCGSGNPLFPSQTGGCVSCSSGGGFSNPATTHFPASLPQNSYNNDPTMQQTSVRIEGVPIKLSGGKKRRGKKSKKTKKGKKGKKTRKQSGGIHLPQIAMSSSLGHNHYGSWFGAPTTQTPEWNESIFTTPSGIHHTGYSKYNPYLV